MIEVQKALDAAKDAVVYLLKHLGQNSGAARGAGYLVAYVQWVTGTPGVIAEFLRRFGEEVTAGRYPEMRPYLVEFGVSCTVALANLETHGAPEAALFFYWNMDDIEPWQIERPKLLTVLETVRVALDEMLLDDLGDLGASNR
jgi:hypothetical protein